MWSVLAISLLMTRQATCEIYAKATESGYGVDVSFPIHHKIDPKSIFGRRYQELMDGCAKAFSKSECEATEVARLKMSLEQPTTQYNYTKVGFKKIKTPKHVFDLIRKFYDENKENKHVEKWGRAYTYTNNWVSPTYMVSPEDSNLRGGGNSLKSQIWNGIQPIIEDWVGKKVKPTSLYGVRIYTTGAILATHVDRLPLVSSCIINVDQDLNEPWPAELYDHDGQAHNVTMEIGDMVLYESHTTLHGRPFPLNGSHFANIFVHYEPLDHAEMNRAAAAHMNIPSGVRRSDYDAEEEEEEEDPEEVRRDVEFRALHLAAAKNDYGTVKRLLEHDLSLVRRKDNNGWEPLHEAARSGHTGMVKFLVDHGADIGSLTNHGESALWWAKRTLSPGHSTISYLEGIGAPEAGEL